MTEDLRVFEVDQRDARCQSRADHIRTIESSSHSHLQNDHVNVLREEIPERDQRQKAEESGPVRDVLGAVLVNTSIKPIPCEP